RAGPRPPDRPPPPAARRAPAHHPGDRASTRRLRLPRPGPVGPALPSPLAGEGSGERGLALVWDDPSLSPEVPPAVVLDDLHPTQVQDVEAGGVPVGVPVIDPRHV